MSENTGEVDMERQGSPEQNRITMQILQGTKHLKVDLFAPDANSNDPFMAKDKKGKIIKLNDHQRLEAYGLMRIAPPQNLVEGLNSYERLKRVKGVKSKTPIRSH